MFAMSLMPACVVSPFCSLTFNTWAPYLPGW